MDTTTALMELLTNTNVLVTLFAGFVSVTLLIFIAKITSKSNAKPKNRKKNVQQIQQEHNKQNDTNQKQSRKKMQENRWQNKGDTFTHPWMLTNFKGHTGQVLNMDFSSNNKYLASNAEEDGDATSETSSYSDTNSSRPSSAEPGSPHKSLSRRQKRNLKKRPTNNGHSKRKSARPSQEWLNLHLTETELVDYLKNFLLTSEEMLSLGYPVETSEGNIIIYKGTDSPKVIKEHKKFVLDANAREFVPKSQRTNDSDSGNCSGSGNTSDSDSADTWNSAEKKKNKQKYKKLAVDPSDSYSEYVYLTDLLNTKVRTLNEAVQFPFYTFTPTSHKQTAYFKMMTFYDENGRSYEQMVLNHPMYPEYNVSDKTTVHSCARCAKYFQMQNGIYIGYNKCHYHVGKLRRRQGQLKFPCCGEPPDSKPCTESTFHVWNGLQMGFNGPFKTFKKTKQRKTLPKGGNFGVYAVDCEMAYTDYGLEAVKVTVVGADGRTVYEAMIKPEHDIWDYNTYYSGITEKDLINAKSLNQVQNDLMGFINADTILIGHGLENDLRALKLLHKTCIDTSALFPHHNGLPFKRGLKTLVRSYLSKNIQKDNQPHNSYEDAASCMELILWKVRNDYGF